MRKKIIFIILIVFTIEYVSIAQEVIFPEVNWPESSPQQQNVDPVKLDEAMQYLGNFIHAKEKSERAMVIRNGYVIWNGGETDSLNCVFSVSKAFATTVLGHLIDQGKCSLKSLAKDYITLDLAEYSDVNLFHLSTMTSGYNSEGPTFTTNGISTPFKPVGPNFKPEEFIEYSDHAAHLYGYVLTRIITKRRGDLESYFRENIARPIGINDAHWFWDTGWPNCKVDNSNPDYADVRSAATGIWISAEALARFGYLYLNNGKWKDKQIISEEWVKKATSVQVPASVPAYGKYGASGIAPGRQGLFWWINEYGGLHNTLLWSNAPKGTYAAVGAHHNWCWVIPEWNMVVVRIGMDNPHYLGNFDKRYDTFFLKLSQAIMD